MKRVGEADRATVLIASDHPGNRSALRTVLDNADLFRVVGEAETGTQAVAMTNSLRPAVVVMDLLFPDSSGVEVAKHITSVCPDVAVTVITHLRDRDTFLSAIRAGARGYLVTSTRPEDLVLALEVTRSGGLVLDPLAADWLVEHLVEPAAARRPFPQLTERERAVLELVADGRGTVAIARELGLAVKTVRNYLSRIFAKLNLVDRTEAAVCARQAGLGTAVSPGLHAELGKSSVPYR